MSNKGSEFVGREVIVFAANVIDAKHRHRSMGRESPRFNRDVSNRAPQ